MARRRDKGDKPEKADKPDSGLIAIEPDETELETLRYLAAWA